LCAASAALGQGYTIGQIGTDTDEIVGVVGINNSGVVVGGTAFSRPYRWSASGGVSILPTLGGSALAKAINELDACVGLSQTSSSIRKPVHWAPNGSITSLGGRDSYSPLALNDLSSPTIVGQTFGSSTRQPALFQNKKWQRLPTLGGLGSATGVDNIGRIVGACYTPSGSERVVLWTKNAAGKYQLTDLTAAYGLLSPNFVPSNEEAPFEVSIRGGRVASMGKILELATGVVTDLEQSGPAGIRIRAINSSGQAVGVVGYHNQAPVVDAFYWDGSAFFDLNEIVLGSGWTLHGASGINDNGQIVGMGDFGGTTRAYVLDLSP
jgi:hypothetical protein